MSKPLFFDYIAYRW